MVMKKTILKSIIFALLLPLVYSCNNKEEDYYSLGDIYITMGLIGNNSDLDYDFVVYCDNGDTLLPMVNANSDFETHNNQRIIVNYTILDNVENSNQKFYVKINSIYEVLYKDLVELTNVNSDSLGTDPVQIQDIWLAKNMLNIEFKYKGNNQMHYINLCYKNVNRSNEEPIELEFRHNANSDEELYVFDAIVTFKLDHLFTTNCTNNNTYGPINFVVKSTNYQNEEQSFGGTLCID